MASLFNYFKKVDGTAPTAAAKKVEKKEEKATGVAVENSAEDAVMQDAAAVEKTEKKAVEKSAVKGKSKAEKDKEKEEKKREKETQKENKTNGKDTPEGKSPAKVSPKKAAAAKQEGGDVEMTDTKEGGEGGVGEEGDAPVQKKRRKEKTLFSDSEDGDQVKPASPKKPTEEKSIEKIDAETRKEDLEKAKKGLASIFEKTKKETQKSKKETPKETEKAVSPKKGAEGGEEKDEIVSNFSEDDFLEEDDASEAEGVKVDANSAAGRAALAAAAKKKKAGGKDATQGGAGSIFAVPLKKGDTGADPLTYSYDPATWDTSLKAKDGLKYSILSDAFDKIAEIRGTGAGSSKSIRCILTNMFRVFILHSPSELTDVVYLALNRIAPDYEGTEVGVGDALLIKAMAEVFGKNETFIKQALQTYTDLGEVAMASRVAQKTLYTPPPLTVKRVITDIRAIAAMQGGASQAKKKDKIKTLLVASKGSEAKYIVRTLQQKLRIGVQSATILQSLADAFVLTRPELKDAQGVTHKPISDIRRVEDKSDRVSSIDLETRLVSLENAVRAAFCEVPNLDIIVGHLLKGEDETTLPERCSVAPGVPVKPMLAKPTKGITEVFDRFEKISFTCEYKYDGERAQVHVIDAKTKNIRVFSRNSEDMTQKYPDLLQFLPDTLGELTESCILDSEVVAYDSEQQKILPFQTLTTRKRKDVNIEDIKVKICLFPFDCIYFNGQSLIKKSLKERREYLRKAIHEVDSKVKFAQYQDCETFEEVEKFLDEAVNSSCEGLMVKTLEENATYEPSKRSLNWLKIKKDYIDGLTDSVDLVPIGASYGKGKRSGVYGAYLLAVWDPEAEQFQTVCRAGTGFSDQDLQTHFDSLKECVVGEKPMHYLVDEKMEPDVWFEAKQVWEIKGADLSISPVHTAAMGLRDSDKGIGIRFPRFLRIRDDKNPEDATNAQQILDMYNDQFRNKKGGDAMDDDE